MTFGGARARPSRCWAACSAARVRRAWRRPRRLRPPRHRPLLELVEAQHGVPAPLPARSTATPAAPSTSSSPPVRRYPPGAHGAARDLDTGGAYTVLYNVLGYPAGVVPVTRVRPDEELGRAPSRDMVQQTAYKVEQDSAGLSRVSGRASISSLRASSPGHRSSPTTRASRAPAARVPRRRPRLLRADDPAVRARRGDRVSRAHQRGARAPHRDRRGRRRERPGAARADGRRERRGVRERLLGRRVAAELVPKVPQRLLVAAPRRWRRSARS